MLKFEWSEVSVLLQFDFRLTIFVKVYKNSCDVSACLQRSLPFLSATHEQVMRYGLRMRKTE
jgi:hypothetical protein